MSKRQFFLNTVHIQVLSEGAPLRGSYDLIDIDEEITDGECVGGEIQIESKPLSPKEAADKLIAFGSEPRFFGLNDDGSDLT